MDSNFTPPPPLTTPPVIQPLPAKPRRSYGWMIVSVILFVLLVFSLSGYVVEMISSAFSFKHDLRSESFGTARESGPRLDESVLKSSPSWNKIAVISVDGIITSHTADQAGNDMVEVIRAQFRRAQHDPKVKAVILKVDSPGGEVLASDDIYKIIRNFQSGSNSKPVICSMGSLAASGGYYISSSCRWIVANELTLTGSIGVIMEGINYRGLMDKIGVAPEVYKSGKFKDMLSGMRETNEIPPEEHALVQNLIDETYGKFKDVVRDGRGAAHDLNKKEGKPLADDWQDYADGRVVSGTQALQLGLVDELGDFDDAVDRTEKIANIQDATLIEYREHYDISDFLSMFGQSQATSARELKVDFGTDIPKLRIGYLYFLWQPPMN